MLKAERDALGFYITAHPLDKYERDLRRFTIGSIEALRGRDNQTKVAVGGVIQSLRLRNNKKGDRYASFTLEDKSGTVEVICWPEMYKRTEIDLTTDEPVCVIGTLEVGEERWQVIADGVDLLTRARERTVQQVHFALSADRIDEQRLHVLRQTLADHRGECPAFLHLLLPNRTETIIALPADLRVAATEGMVDAVEQLFGRGVASFQ
jgi:DNA polymerase-3 subunit alpha